jgi:hypothetical protein
MLFGISLPALVGLLVEVLKKVGIVATGDQARIANIVLSALGAMAVALLAEFEFEAPQLVIIIVAAVYSVVASALGYTTGEAVAERIAG